MPMEDTERHWYFLMKIAHAVKEKLFAFLEFICGGVYMWGVVPSKISTLT